MDQIKIGKFIAQIRKERNMTQLDLANMLGVTDRAISKWENGRGMPEISLIKPLCDALSISVNELFSGERISNEQLTDKAEENIVNTLTYSRNKLIKTKVIFIFILASIAFVITLISTLFAIDVDRMRNNKPVFFSTWGIDYTPPIDLQDEEIEYAIKNYLVVQGDNEEKHEDGVKTFVAIKTYLIENVDTKGKYNVYAWVLEKQCYLKNNEVLEYSAFSMPFKFTVKENENKNGFTVEESRFPRDGYYTEDMKELFSKSVIKEMNKLHKDGSFEKLEFEIDEQKQLYFHK